MARGGHRNTFAVSAALTSLTAAAFATSASAQDPAAATDLSETVYLEADQVKENRLTGEYIASGNVEARYGTRILRADEVVFRPADARVIARGNVAIVDDTGLVTFADEAELSDDLSEAVISGFAARLDNNATMAARVATRDANDDFRIVRGFYTACVACAKNDRENRPTWRIRARRVTRDASKDGIFYRDAVLEVKGVPVAYSPYFAHADPTADRKSGFLLPNLGESSRTGTFYQQPYYWAISPSQDLVIAPRAMSEVNPLVAFEYRKRFFSGGVLVQGSATAEKEINLLDDGEIARLTEEELIALNAEDAEFRGHVFGEGAFRITESWTWGFGVERVTGDAYLDRYDIPDANVRRGLYRRQSRRLLSQAYAVRQTKDSYSSIAAFDAQDLRLEDEDELPVAAPFAEIRKMFGMRFLGGRTEARANLAVLERRAGVDYRRLTIETEWNRRIVSKSGVLFSPFALARGDFYSLQGEQLPEDTVSGIEEPIDTQATRALGNIGADLSFPVGRRLGPIDVVLEPIANVTVAPQDVNDDELVNLDSQSIDLDEASVFSANRSTGYDVFEEGAHASVGARASADWSNDGSVSLFVGQSYRAEDLGQFEPSSGLDGRTSDIVGALAMQLGRRTELDAKVRVDNQGGEIQRLDVVGRTGIGPISVGARYLQFDQELADRSQRPAREANVDVGLDITRNWSAYYRFNRDLDAEETRREFIGLVYTDNCTRVEVVYKSENFEERIAGRDDSLTVRFTLATLGSFESN